MTIDTAIANARPVRVLNEAVLMFVRITQVLNKRDDMNDKIKRSSFYNSIAEAKSASYDLQRGNDVGYLWMTQTTDTLNEDGSVDRVNENFMWTKRQQWQRKETKAYTISPEDVAKAASNTNGSTDGASDLPAKDEGADF